MRKKKQKQIVIFSVNYLPMATLWQTNCIFLIKPVANFTAKINKKTIHIHIYIHIHILILVLTLCS